MGTRPRFLRVGLGPLFLWLLSSATSDLPSVSAGESPWVEVRSPNFSVITDAGEKRGREVAMRFEQMRAVFGTLMTKAKVNLPVPLQIVAFRSTKEMRQMAPLFHGKPTQVAGLFQGGSDRSFIMLDMSAENPWAIVFHEYAHQLMNGNLQAVSDPWFEEGFAEYFSSIEVDGKEARLGKISRDDYLIMQQVGSMKVADLFKVQHYSETYNETGNARTVFYTESGMLVHYIYDNQLLPKVSVYFDLKINKHVSVEDAIQQAFGMSAGQLDKTLRNYMSAGHYRYYPIPAPANISEKLYSSSPMTAADASAVLADIHLHSPDYQDKAVAEFNEILKSDPSNAAACRGLGYESGFSLDDTAALTQELETSISLDPNFADSYALLAFAQMTSGDSVKALPNLLKAIEISPRNPDYRLNLANVYLANKQPDQAKTVLASLKTSDNPVIASRAEAILEQIKNFEQFKKLAAEGLSPLDRKAEEEKSDTGSVQAENSGPIKFLRGTLTSVDCSTPQVTLLTIASGSKTWKMKVRDREHLVLIGADNFSCSWNKKKVAVNYREAPDGQASIVSLEIQ